MVAKLLIALAAIQSQPAAAPADPPAIVVTGERIGDLRAALRACLARNCPPNEDIDATLALAEAEFLNGEYERSEEAIGASIHRNRRDRRAYPEPVADLYRSRARVQSHRGRDDLALESTREILRTLRLGIPQEDHRHFTARFERVQAELRKGNRTGVLRELSALKEAARRAGRDDVVRRAAMRELQLRYLLAPNGDAGRRMEALAESTNPAEQYEAVAARFFLASVYRDRGEIARSDAMLAQLPSGDGSTRALLYAPPIELTRALAPPSSLITTMDVDNFHDTWIDVGYWIQPDGGVDGVEVLRQGSDADWAGPLLKSIRGRLFARSTDATASYRVERYTYTAGQGVRTGTRLTMRTGRPRVEYFDLTAPSEPGRAPTDGIKPAAPAPVPAG